MNLEERVMEDMKASMKQKDTKRLEVIRAIKSAIILSKTKKVQVEDSAKEEVLLLQRLIKQRRESAKLYQEQSREDLAEDELYQLSVLEEFLPEQMTDEALKTEIAEAISQFGGKDQAKFPELMKSLSTKLSGQVDNKKLVDFIKNALN